MNIFNLIGYIFGYILWFFFNLFNNFGVAIIFFTIVIKVMLFPFSIKQQKSAIANSRISKKQKEIQKKYGKDKQKINEETTKLYQEEGFNPMGGCLNSIVPLFLWLSVYYSVIRPLQNTLHIAADKVASAVSVLNTVPVIGDSFNSTYGEIEIIKLLPYIKNQLTMFSSSEISKISELSKGFNFLGFDLLATPKGSSFSSMLWLIPVLCFLSYIVTTFFTQRIQKNPAAEGQGCMNATMYVLPLFSAWIAYTVPAAIGFYWIISTVLGFIQMIILNHYYNIYTVNAKSEARRIEYLKVLEVQEKESYDPSRYKEIDYVEAANEKRVNKSKKKGNKTKKSGSKDSYLGSKK